MRLETQDDQIRQRNVADVLEHHFIGHTFHTYPSLFVFDWYSENESGLLTGNWELKWRNIASTDYPTLFFSYRKWVSLMLAEVMSDIPGHICYQLTDGILHQRINKLDVGSMSIRARSGRTTQTRRPEDIEPCIMLRVDELVRL